MKLSQTSLTDSHRQETQEFLFKDLTYVIIGALLEVSKELGFGFDEKVYQTAFQKELELRSLKFKRENYSRISYKGRRVGSKFFDFIIDDKVVVELKVGKDLYFQHLKQLLSYLKSSGLKVGILAAFTPSGLIYKRVVN